MTNITPFLRDKTVYSIESRTSERFAHVHQMGDNTCRLRFGIGETAGEMYIGLKFEDARDLADEWVSGASLDEMRKSAHKVGGR